MDWFTEFGPWSWVSIAVALAIVELIVPTNFFIFLAVPALIVAMLDLWLHMDVTTDLLVYSLLTLCSIGLWVYINKIRVGEKPKRDGRDVHERGKLLIGRVAVVETAIENGTGKVKIGDTLWRVQGEDCEVGSLVIVEEVDGTTLLVRPKAESSAQ